MNHSMHRGCIKIQHCLNIKQNGVAGFPQKMLAVSPSSPPPGSPDWQQGHGLALISTALSLGPSRAIPGGHKLAE